MDLLTLIAHPSLHRPPAPKKVHQPPLNFLELFEPFRNSGQRAILIFPEKKMKIEKNRSRIGGGEGEEKEVEGGGVSMEPSRKFKKSPAGLEILKKHHHHNKHVFAERAI